VCLGVTAPSGTGLSSPWRTGQRSGRTPREPLAASLPVPVGALAFNAGTGPAFGSRRSRRSGRGLQIREHQVGPLHLGDDDPGHHQPYPRLFGRQFGRCFYTPFGVRCFGTGDLDGAVRSALQTAFLYALRREVLRNLGLGADPQGTRRLLYALRREVLRNRRLQSGTFICRLQVSIRPSA